MLKNKLPPTLQEKWEVYKATLEEYISLKENLEITDFFYSALKAQKIRSSLLRQEADLIHAEDEFLQAVIDLEEGKEKKDKKGSLADWVESLDTRVLALENAVNLLEYEP